MRSAMKTRLPFIRPRTQISRLPKDRVISSPSSATRRAISSSREEDGNLGLSWLSAGMIRLSRARSARFSSRTSSRVKRASRPPGEGQAAAGRAAFARASCRTRSTWSAPDPARARRPGRSAWRSAARATARGRPGEGRAAQDERVAFLAARSRRAAPRPRPRTCAASSARSDAVRASAARIARVEALLEVGQQLVPHAVAPVGGVGVRRVLAPVEAALAQVREDLLARDREQRAERVARCAAACPRGPVAPAPRSSRSSSVSAWSSRVWATAIAARLLLVAHAPQEGVALAARGLLEAAPLARGPGAHVGRSRPEAGRRAARTARAQKAASSAEPGRRPWSRWAATSAEAAAAAQRGERVEERDGVGAAGEADDERLAPGRAPRGPQGAIDGRDEGRQPQGRASSGEGGVVAVQGFEPRTPRI